MADIDDMKIRLIRLEKDLEDLVGAVEQLVEWQEDLTEALRIASSLYKSLQATVEEVKDEQREIRWVGKTDKPPF